MKKKIEKQQKDEGEDETQDTILQHNQLIEGSTEICKISDFSTGISVELGSKHIKIQDLVNVGADCFDFCLKRKQKSNFSSYIN